MKNVMPSSCSINKDWNKFVNEFAIVDPDAYLDKAIMQQDDITFLQLGISTLCNFDCPFCYNHYNPKIGYYSYSTLPAEDVIDYVRKNEPIHSLLFAVSGEPFLHLHFFKILDGITPYCKIINISTNGALVNRKVVDRLKDFPIGNITLSVDASDQSCYERFRTNGKFEIFLKHASYLCERFYGKIWIAAVLCNGNVDSLLQLPKLLNSFGGVLGLTLLNVVVHPEYIKDGIKALYEEEKYEFLIRFLEQCDKYNVLPTWQPSFIQYSTAKRIYKQTGGRYCSDLERYFRPCYMPFNTMLVDPEGNYNFCCGIEPTFGDALNVPLIDIFNSDMVKKMRVLNALQRFPEVCEKHCHMRPSNDIDVNLKTLEQVIKTFKDPLVSVPGEFPPWPKVEMIPKESKILIWPYGTFTRQLISKRYFGDDVIGIVDRNEKVRDSMPYQMNYYTVKDLSPVDFDTIIITSATFWKEILREFDHLYGLDSKEIYFISQNEVLYKFNPSYSD